MTTSSLSSLINLASFSLTTSAKTTPPLAAWELLPLRLNVPAGTPILVLADNARVADNLLRAWRFFVPTAKVAYFPDWELLPYERFSPNQDLVSARLATLWQIAAGQIEVVITTVATAMQKLPPPAFILEHSMQFSRGQQLQPAFLQEILAAGGYQHVTQVLAPREFARRGSIIDLFPMGAEYPYRLDFFDNELDSIRTFDPVSQRTINTVNTVRLLSAYEFPTDAAAVKTFQANFRRIFGDKAVASEVYQAVGKNLYGGGIEFYAPLFFVDNYCNLFDYLPADTLLLTGSKVDSIASAFSREIHSRFTLAGGDSAYPPLEPSYLFLSAAEFTDKINALRHLQVEVLPDNGRIPKGAISINRNKVNPLAALVKFTAESLCRTLILADSPGRGETITALFAAQHLQLMPVTSWQEFLTNDHPWVLMICPDFEHGLFLPDARLLLITESDLYEDHTRRFVPRTKYQPLTDGVIMDLAEIKVGDLIVHENHGIGKYLGLTTIDNGEFTEEFMLLEYKNEARLYVPVSQLNLISRYRGGSGKTVELQQLGHGAWQKSKEKALAKAHDTAAELLNIYAQRELQQGFSCRLNTADYQRFVAGFTYEETPDQNEAITAVIADLARAQPMDRLVCGDVGFGKTEVALRAAFIVAMAGFQVAVLAPTTLLVEQHEETFKTRFADFPLRMESLSRFATAKKSATVAADLAAGKVDIVIGTQKLLQKQIKFKNLGLVVIDEEHRFGVRQKEQFKKYRTGVNVLTMTATPIPRTLAMALEQLRAFSLITTAPAKRLAIKTLVQPFSEGLITEAVKREMKRNGQIFFLHNEVASSAAMLSRLQRLLPEARICVAHGQMLERQLEQILRAFLRRQYDVMICSTIIETGMDIPNVNTIIINHAEDFGLAQLHQLRGRVGRANHQAYAYLLTGDYLTKDAEQRLAAIAATTELGSGFFLAQQDLEIRGSGEILGDNQSGEVLNVGLNLYVDMLHKAVADLKAGIIPAVNTAVNAEPEIKLHCPALIPADYCQDVHERLIFYKKFAAAASSEDLTRLWEELIDRFGPAPIAVKNLSAVHELRLTAEKLGIQIIDAAPEKIMVLFGEQTSVKPAVLTRIMQQQPKLYQLTGVKLTLKTALPEVSARLARLRELLTALTAAT